MICSTSIRRKDGTFRAELNGRCAQRSLLLQYKIDEDERDLVFALLLMGSAGQNQDSAEINAEWHRLIGERFSSALGSDVRVLADSQAKAAERLAARKSALRVFKTALDALEKRGRRPVHKSSAHHKYTAGDGLPREMPAAWVAIEVAREMVEANHELPDKRDVRQRVEKLLGRTLTDQSWTTIFADAGLEDLPACRLAGGWPT